MRTGTYTVPRPRLTNIVVWSRRPMPATTGNFCAATAPDQRQDDLSAVRVARQHERHLQGRRFRQPSRVVRQQDHEARRTARDRGDVAGAFGPVANPHQIDRLAPDRHARARVLQHLDAARGQRRRHVVVVVVVAEDAVHAVGAESGASASADGWTYCRSPQVT